MEELWLNHRRFAKTEGQVRVTCAGLWDSNMLRQEKYAKKKALSSLLKE
jgi:hypothetical protein